MLLPISVAPNKDQTASLAEEYIEALCEATTCSCNAFTDKNNQNVVIECLRQTLLLTESSIDTRYRWIVKPAVYFDLHVESSHGKFDLCIQYSHLKRMKPDTQTISLKVPRSLSLRLARAARQSSRSKSEIIREAVNIYLRSDASDTTKSGLDGIEDLIGTFEGVEDAATNEDYLRDLGR